MSLVYHRLEKPRWCLPVPGAGTGRQANVGLLLGYGNEADRIEAGQGMRLQLRLLQQRAQFRVDTVGGVQYLRRLWMAGMFVGHVLGHFRKAVEGQITVVLDEVPAADGAQ